VINTSRIGFEALVPRAPQPPVFGELASLETLGLRCELASLETIPEES